MTVTSIVNSLSLLIDNEKSNFWQAGGNHVGTLFEGNSIIKIFSIGSKR